MSLTEDSMPLSINTSAPANATPVDAGEMSPSSQEALMALLLPELDQSEVNTLLNSPTVIGTPDSDEGLLPIDLDGGFQFTDEDLAQLMRSLEQGIGVPGVGATGLFAGTALGVTAGDSYMQLDDLSSNFQFDFTDSDLLKFAPTAPLMSDEDAAAMFFMDATANPADAYAYAQEMPATEVAEDALFMEIIQN
jgi:hypothetical protein